MLKIVRKFSHLIGFEFRQIGRGQRGWICYDTTLVRAGAYGWANWNVRIAEQWSHSQNATGIYEPQCDPLSKGWNQSAINKPWTILAWIMKYQQENYNPTFMRSFKEPMKTLLDRASFFSVIFVMLSFGNIRHEGGESGVILLRLTIWTFINSRPVTAVIQCIRYYRINALSSRQCQWKTPSSLIIQRLHL